MVLPVGPRHNAQYLVKLTKRAGGGLTREELIAVRFVPLLSGRAREL
jgi:protein-L-isoaspartate(D-aspartate) O-methyltransferase